MTRNLLPVILPWLLDSPYPRGYMFKEEPRIGSCHKMNKAKKSRKTMQKISEKKNRR